MSLEIEFSSISKNHPNKSTKQLHFKHSAISPQDSKFIKIIISIASKQKGTKKNLSEAGFSYNLSKKKVLARLAFFFFSFLLQSQHSQIFQ